MYAGIRSTLVQDGVENEKFSGIDAPRQSRPLSPVLLVLVPESFFEAVLRHPEIKGFPLKQVN